MHPFSVTHPEEHMLAIIGAIVVICWLLGLTAFHVTGGIIHLALIVGVILIVAHFLTGRTRTI
jgi:hypothetical protein